MTLLAAPSVRLLTAAVVARVNALGYVTVYRGGIGKGQQPPILQINGQPDPDKRVAPYVNVYPSPGRTSSASLGARTDARRPDMDWSVQVSAVAGYPELTDALIDDLHAQLDGWAPTIPDHVVGPLEQLNDPGPVRPDDAFAPARWFTPLIYGLAATTI